MKGWLVRQYWECLIAGNLDEPCISERPHSRQWCGWRYRPVTRADLEALIEPMVQGIVDHDMTGRPGWRLATEYRDLLREGFAALVSTEMAET